MEEMDAAINAVLRQTGNLRQQEIVWLRMDRVGCDKNYSYVHAFGWMVFHIVSIVC